MSGNTQSHVINGEFKLKTKFPVGSLVFDCRYGWGTVITEPPPISGDVLNKSICVTFNKSPSGPLSSYISYLHDGKISGYHFAPSLLTKEEAAKLGHFPPYIQKVKKEYFANVYKTEPDGHFRLGHLWNTEAQALFEVMEQKDERYVGLTKIEFEVEE